MDEHLHHETSDIDIRGVLTFGGGLLGAAIVISFLVWLLFVYLSGREAVRTTPRFPLATTQEQRLPPEPRLQTNPRQDLNDLRTQEDVVLGNYGWMDKTAGTVRIPIEEAMRLVVRRGLPTRPENAK